MLTRQVIVSRAKAPGRWERGRPGALLFLAATTVGVLLATYKYLDRVTIGVDARLSIPLIEELTAAYGAALLLWFGARRYAWKIRWFSGNAPTSVAAHLLGAVIFSIAHTTANWILRSIVFAALGLGSYHYGEMPARYAMEMPMDVIVYALFVVGVHAAWRFAESKQAELTAAHMEAQLLDTKLLHLRGQLHPHFLFNSLNTISSVMYDNPAAADEMMGHLGDLLRASLNANAPVTTLREELALLDHYLALLRSRFGDRLDVTVQATPEALEREVPSLLLQPLVENAVRHGGVEQRGNGRIAIEAAIDRGFLRIDVTDDGPGVPAGTDVLSSGIGLSSTRERLRLMYGHDGQIEAGNLPGGGFRVRLMLDPLDSRPPSSRA